jgi:hypothetical protein
VRNEEVLQRVKEESNVLHIRTIKIRKAEWIGYILRRNCLLQHVILRKGISNGKTRKEREDTVH